MSKPLTVTIPHNLGKEEALRRIKTGVGQARQQFGNVLGAVEENWTGDRMDFRVAALGQTVTGNLTVMADSVHMELQLPWALAMIAEKAKAVIRRQGQLMLEKK